MRVITHGTSRVVIITKTRAYKIPRFWRLPKRIAGSVQSPWRVFIRGVCANMTEVEFGYSGSPHLCPVLWHIDGGFLVVMPSCEVLDREITEEEYRRFSDAQIPFDPAQGNFGFYNGELVAIDYGA